MSQFGVGLKVTVDAYQRYANPLDPDDGTKSNSAVFNSVAKGQMLFFSMYSKVGFCKGLESLVCFREQKSP